LMPRPRPASCRMRRRRRLIRPFSRACGA
jgi:hypothetical protein